MGGVFLHGPLAHQGLRDVVLAETQTALPVQVPGFTALKSNAEFAAFLVPDPSGQVAGCLIQDVSSVASARLSFFQSVMGCRPLMVRDVLDDPFTLYLGAEMPPASADLWDQTEFETTWATAWIFAAEEIMDWFGRKDPVDLISIRSGIFRRAWSWAMNAAGTDVRELDREVAVLRRHRPYLNFFGVDEIDLQHTRHDGALSAEMNRGALMVGNASVVLPYDPVRDTVLLTEQFRAPLHLAGEPNPWVWEPVAGLIDAGETAEQAAHREAQEEAGLTIDRLEKAGRVYSSTGAVSECLYLFVGLCDLSGPAQNGGLDCEGEDIRSRILSFDCLMQDVDAQTCVDMPLLTTALWLARHRNRLRA